MIGYHLDWIDGLNKELHRAIIVRTKDWYGPDGWVVCAHERLGETDTHVVSVQFSRPREPGPAQCVYTPIERVPTEFEAA
jgi:hypothetical protein